MSQVLIKFLFCKFHHMKNFRRQCSLNHIHTVTTILKSQTDIGNEEIDLREKNKLSWQNT